LIGQHVIRMYMHNHARTDQFKETAHLLTRRFHILKIVCRETHCFWDIWFRKILRPWIGL